MFRTLIIVLVVVGAALSPGEVQSAEPTMADYTAYPPFLIVSPMPNVLVLMDNSGSTFDFSYNFNGSGVSTGFDPNTTYYGYFNSSMWYTYDGTKFVEAASKASRGKQANEWDGNFLNWLTMR